MTSELAKDDPLVEELLDVFERGDVDGLRDLLDRSPRIANIRVAAGRAGDVSRTVLHVLADWPANRPRADEMVRLLVDAGADPSARCTGAHTETPLHWAASSDDVVLLDALLDAGADIDAAGSVVGGGTALMDAAAFGQWAAARRLVERGTAVGLWDGAALGRTDAVAAALATDPTPTPEDVTGAFWGACHGGSIDTARMLLDAGADPTWVGWDDLTASGAAARAGHDGVVAWLDTVDRP